MLSGMANSDSWDEQIEDIVTLFIKEYFHEIVETWE